MGYFRKHWRGEFSLRVSFWVNFVLFNIILGLIALLNSKQLFTDNPVFISRIAISLVAVQYFMIFPWQIIGLWRRGGGGKILFEFGGGWGYKDCL